MFPNSPLPLLLKRVHSHLVIAHQLVLKHIYLVLLLQVKVRAVKPERRLSQQGIDLFGLLVQDADELLFAVEVQRIAFFFDLLQKLERHLEIIITGPNHA